MGLSTGRGVQKRTPGQSPFSRRPHSATLRSRRHKLSTPSSLIIGGGIVGLATARQLLRQHPGAIVTVLEKESAPGRHQTGHNSGVLHCGLYYTPGSLKARLAVEGIREMVEFCEEHNVPHEVCGKLVVATNNADVARLEKLLEPRLRLVRLLLCVTEPLQSGNAEGKSKKKNLKSEKNRNFSLEIILKIRNFEILIFDFRFSI